MTAAALILYALGCVMAAALRDENSPDTTFRQDALFIFGWPGFALAAVIVALAAVLFSGPNA